MQIYHQHISGKVPMRLIVSTLVFTLSVLGCANQTSSTNTAAEPKSPTQTSAKLQNSTLIPTPIIQQYALDRLKQMSEYLASAKALTYRSKNSLELPENTGQFLTYFAETDVALQRPNKLRVIVTGDVPNYQVYFDGSKITAFDPQRNIHAVSEQLRSIDEVLDYVITKTEMYLPSANLMYSDPYAALTKDLTQATVVGPTMVNGKPCEHFAYKSPGTDWEIWIESGKNPLPRRLTAIYKEANYLPRYMIEYSDWNLRPKLKKDLFGFNIPANSQQVDFGKRITQSAM